MNKSLKSSHGFTLIELMIATTIFSVILLLITTGMIEVGRMFYKGVISTNTQETTRLLIEDISQAIQFSGDEFTPLNAGAPLATKRFCIGDRRYTFTPNTRLNPNGSNHAFIIDKASTKCTSTTPVANMANPSAATAFRDSTVPPRELMGANMRIAAFNITEDAVNKAYTITIRVAYGDDTDVLFDSNGDGTLDSCLNQRSSSQFCSVSELSTTVKRRVE